MKEKKEQIVAMNEIAGILHILQDRLEKMENRLDMIESTISQKPTKKMWAKPIEQLVNSNAGLSISSSSTPPTVMQKEKEILLSGADNQIMHYIRIHGAVCAQDIQIELKYRGKNAASARLSKLYELGILQKQQVGRVVYYRVNE